MGFVSHHVEALPFIRKQMERHETLVLEEPSGPGFPGMLNGRLSVDDYLLEIDSEFPRFDRLMCGLLMEFHGMGRRIIQVEPYLERLIEIHERFADGKTVADVMASDSLRNVYRAERAATGALIAYYSNNILYPVPHRQFVFSIPIMLRIYFKYDRKLLTKLCHCAKESLEVFFATVLGLDGGSRG